MRKPSSSQDGSWPVEAVIHALKEAGCTVTKLPQDESGEAYMIENRQGDVEIQYFPEIVGYKAIQRLIARYGSEEIVPALLEFRKSYN
jgi:hypothetical protein